MKHYSKEFKEEALKLFRRDRREEGRTAARYCVLHAGGLAQHTPKYTAREDTERRGTDDPHP